MTSLKNLTLVLLLILLLPSISYSESSGQRLKRILKSFEIYPTHWLPHIQLARFYLEQGSLSLAIKTLQDSAAKFPDHIPIKQEMARLYQQIGSSQEALKIYQDLQQRFPKDQDIFLQYIKLLISMNRVRQAESQLVQFLDEKPNSFQALLLMGTLKYRQKRNQEALAYLLRSATLRSSSETWRWLSLVWYQLRQVDSAIKAAEESLRLNPTEAVTVELYTEYLYVAKKFDKLGKILVQSQERFGQETWFLIAKGSYAFEVGQFAEAEEAFAKAYRLEPTELKVVLALSTFYIKQKQLDENITILQKSLTHHRNSEIYRRIATSYKLLGQFKNANRYYELLVNTERSHAQDFLNAAQLAWVTKDFLNAEFYLMQGTLKFPQSLPLGLELARFYILEQRPDDARPVFEQLKTKHSQNPLVLALFGLFEKSQKQLESSATLFQSASLWDPKLLWVRGEYISVLLDLKKTKEAIKELKSLIRDVPKNVWAYHRLHQLYLEQNQDFQAKSLQEQASLFLGDGHVVTLELQANFAFSQKKYAEALELYQLILWQEPTNQGVMRHIGFSQFHLGELEKAQEFLKAGLEFRSINTEYWLYWGAIQEDQNWLNAQQQKRLRNLLQTTSFQERLAIFEKMPFPDTDSQTAWSEVFHGLMAQQEDDLQTARKHYQNANKLLPNQAIVLALLGIVADQSEKPLEAIQYYKDASIADDLWLKTRLAMLLGEVGEFEEGIEIFQSLLQGHPQEASLLNNIAWLQITRPDVSDQTRKEALKLATQAVKLVPSPEYLDTLAEAYFQLGDIEKALELIEQAQKQSFRETEQYFYMLRQSYRFLKSTPAQPPSNPTYQNFKKETDD